MAYARAAALGLLHDHELRDILAATHDRSLGDARSVNEAWCRADQTRRIVEWMEARCEGPIEPGACVTVNIQGFAREFGAKP